MRGVHAENVSPLRKPRQKPFPQPRLKNEKDEPVKEIRIHAVDGRTVFDVELERNNAPNSHLRVAADGTVLRDSRRAAAPAVVTPEAVYSEYPTEGYIPRITLADLPAAVQRTVSGRPGDWHRHFRSHRWPTCLPS